MTNKNIGVLYCFMAGLGAGIAIGILFAPESGAAMRDLISRKTEDGKDLLKAKIEEGRRQVERQGAQIRDQANKFVKRSISGTDKLQEEFAEVAEANALRSATS
jgi:gas vesicle protein